MNGSGKASVLCFGTAVLCYVATLGFPTCAYAQQDTTVVYINDASSDEAEADTSGQAAIQAYNTAVEAVENGRTEVALAAYSKALRLAPGFPEALFNRAALYMAEERYIEALGDYENYLSEVDTAGPAWFFIAQAMEFIDRHEDAIAAYDTAISMGVYPDKALLAKGKIYYGTKRYADAISVYTAYLDSHPSDALILHDRGGLYAMVKDFKAAERDYRHAAKLDPAMSQAWANLGSVLRNQKRMDEAIEAYDMAASLAPDDPLVLNNRGQVKYLNGNYREAAQDFREAVRVDAHYAFAYNNLAGALIKQKLYSDAADAADNAIALDPTYGYAYLNRGIAREMIRDVEGACQDWGMAAEFNVKAADSYRSAICKSSPQ